MSRPFRLRVRLALLFVGGFAVLLGVGGVVLYLLLARNVRADFDRNLRASGEGAAGLWMLDLPERGTPEATVAHIVTELIFADRTLVGYDRDGNRLATSRRYPTAPVLDDVTPGGPVNQPFTVTLRAGRARVLRVPLLDGVELYIAMSTSMLEERLEHLRLTLLLGLPAVLLAGGVLGAWGSRFALRPIVTVADAAERIGQEVEAGAMTFKRLPPQTAKDEISSLTRAFNTLVDRLTSALGRERAVADRQRAFLADAAHELRTPVAILQSEAEVALGATPDTASWRTALETIADEARGMGDLVGDLLLMARGDLSQRTLRRERVYLDDVANRVLSRVRSLPAARGRRIDRGVFEAAPVDADPVLIERAVLVLVHNALVHAAPAPIQVSTGASLGEAGRSWSWLRVRDWGPGVPREQHSRIFERFTRLGGAPGAGLGLAIGRWIAEAHGGTLAIEAEVSPGISFLLRIPSSAPAVDQ